MQAVLDQLQALGAKPLETLTPQQARRQPSPADAVRAVLEAQGLSATPEMVAEVRNALFDGPAGPVTVRLYWPAHVDKGELPLLLYIHGGGWVIADLDVYDASARALANASGAIVMSTHYRQGPEHKFPAGHDDTVAAYRWLLDNASDLGGDASRVAIAGESAGGNMAANVSIQARDRGWQLPLHQLLVYPVANNDMQSPSYVENADAKPLNRKGMEWFVKHAFNSPDDSSDPRICLVSNPDLSSLPPTTIILAQIDPLRSEGEAFAEQLLAAGVDVIVEQFGGVTHEFFGMGAVVDEAKQAQQLAGERLKRAFVQSPPVQRPDQSHLIGRQPPANR